MQTIKEKTEYLIKNKPEKIVEMVEEIYEKYPDEVEVELNLAVYGKHILSEEQYTAIMDCFPVKPYFDYNILKEPETSNIDFSKEDFSEYDFMYAINRLHMQFHDIIDKLEDYVAMAHRYLKDSYSPYDPSEKAYREAKEIKKQHKK